MLKFKQLHDCAVKHNVRCFQFFYHHLLFEVWKKLVLQTSCRTISYVFRTKILCKLLSWYHGLIPSAVIVVIYWKQTRFSRHGNNCICMVFLIIMVHFIYCLSFTSLENLVLCVQRCVQLPGWEDYRLVGWSVNTELRKLPQQKSICDFGQIISLSHISILFVCEHCY